MSVYLAVITVYFSLIILLSFLTKRAAGRSSADFLVAGRNLGLITCSVVIAAEWLGGMSTIGVSENAFMSGTLQPVLYNLSTAAGMIIIGFTVASHYRRNNVHTVSEMIGNIFGVRTALVSALAFLTAYIVLAFVQLQTCASVISALFRNELGFLAAISWLPGNEWFWALIISSAVITAYIYIGGMHAITLTAIIHVVVMFAGIGISVFAGLSHFEGASQLHEALIATGSPHDLWNPFSGSINYAVMLVVGGVLGGMAGQASIQPVFAARDASTARRSAILSALIIAPFGIMVALLGLMARTGIFPDASSVDPKMVLPALLTSESFIHPVAGGLALAGVLAAILSTVGPVNFAVVTIATKDIYNGLLRKEAGESELISTARKFVVLVNLITIPMACIAKGAILDTAYISYGIRAIGAIVILGGIYLRGWISVLGVKLAFIGGTMAVMFNIAVSAAARRLEILEKGENFFENTWVAVFAALLFIIAGNIFEWRRRRRLNI